MGDKLGLVIPTLNEEGTLGTLLDRVRTNLERLQFDFEVIVVDDDSRDGTQQIVNQLRASDPRIRLMVRKEARGLAGAVIYGWERTDANLLG